MYLCRTTYLVRLQSDVQQRRMLLDNHKVHLSRCVSLGEHHQFVNAGQQNAPEFAVARRLESDVATLDLQRCSLDRRTSAVHHEALHAAMRFGQKLDERQLIVLPVLAQLVRRRELAARHLQSHFHAAEPDVVVVLHAASQRIPSGAVRDAIVE